ncbi:MAG: hypothetical protein HYU36_25490 [Planctomycetes bacterium]|nr:hypothetical protein [Planctomycetota bacterium]
MKLQEKQVFAYRDILLLAGLLAFGASCPWARSESLSDEGRIGKVVDFQGIVSVKSAMLPRWTLAEDDLLLQPGDWLRTDVRGANAMQVRTRAHASVILGPGSLAELIGDSRLRLIRGEAEVSVAEGVNFQLIAAADSVLPVQGVQVFRSREGQITRLDKEPAWLQGFKGSLTTESLGSLLATVEGRNVPLTVGYHKVTVDIRDQIARTVIEESFVNHTDSRLEGVFYFPLPQEASISGFGMWIGNELVEADVVEKERAREIYETILREKRDPGLLEWSGGNIFKARVFPIFAHSEKRITLTYTQVLPLRDGRSRYSYALQSELLKQHPLRELALDVRIHSALPLKGVKCPSHETRLDRTEHSARVEFSAQEYTPDRDFEVDIEMDNAQTPLAIVPHQRGEDGYFLLLLNPPQPPSGQEVTPGGSAEQVEALDLLILADTSGSMDASQREAQAAFIGALLASLGEKDTFNLATCDTEVRWLSPEAVPATEANLMLAQEFLAARRSLGWTDLDQAFASARQRARPHTHVVYAGDGILTTGDGDPVALVQRLGFREPSGQFEKAAAGRPGIYHTVATGSSFEPAVLKAIATFGGGSFRRLEGEKGPQDAARQFLGEIARPVLTNLKVQFQGFRTARVYPEELPNLPAGHQHILLGRFLPDGKALAGEVIVTGTRDGKPVEFRSAVSLPQGEESNSFIPRLWARLHLDSLLEQGRSPEIKEEIIALSEEYQIMTPYTSFLVLESDSDRERFKVKRRFKMRDGEKFFAEGRDAASFELLQKQMKLAGNWRVGLRREVLREMARLGRDRSLFLSVREINSYSDEMGGGRLVGFAGGKVREGGRDSLERSMHFARYKDGRLSRSETIRGDAQSNEFILADKEKEDSDALPESPPAYAAEPASGESDMPEDRKDMDRLEEAQKLVDADESVDGPLAMSKEAEAPMPAESKPAASPPPARQEAARKRSYLAKAKSEEVMWEEDSRRGTGSNDRKNLAGIPVLSSRIENFGGDDLVRIQGGSISYSHSGSPWLGSLFPYLPPAPRPAATAAPVQAGPEWPEAAKALARSLSRRERLAALPGGLEIRQDSEGYDVRRGQLAYTSTALALISGKSWVTRTSSDGSQTLVNWCNDRARVVVAPVFQLGRNRPSEPEDIAQVPFHLSDYSLGGLEISFSAYVPVLEDQGDGHILLKLTHSSSPDSETRILIDDRRHVILQIEYRSRGKVGSTVNFSEFIEVAGSTWAARVETLDGEGKRTGLQKLQVAECPADAFAKRVAEELRGLEQALLIREPLPAVAEARQALADGKADFEAHLVLLQHFTASQQWERVQEHLEQAEKAAAGKPGLPWLRQAVLHASRRHEELRQALQGKANEMAADQRPDEYFLAQYLFGQVASFLQANEMLAWLDTLQTLYARQPAHVLALKTWSTYRTTYLDQAGQPDAAFQLREALAKEHRLDLSLQQQYLWGLQNRGDYEAVYRWIDELLARGGPWLPYEEDALHGHATQLLEQEGRLGDLAVYLEGWVERNPSSSTAYAQYLSVLVRTEQAAKAEAQMEAWFQEALKAGTPEGPARARLEASVAQALGQGHNLYTNRLDERWLQPLSQVVRAYARDPALSHLTDRIMGHWPFQNSDACRTLRRDFARVLVEQMPQLEPASIPRLIEWVWRDDPAVEREAWKQMADGLTRRWEAEKSPEVRNQLAQPLVRILSSRLGATELLAFLHRQVREGPEVYWVSYRQQLFNTLLVQPWSGEYEDEASGLLGQLSDSADADARLMAQVDALYHLCDWSVSARYAASMAAVEHQENLSRTELKALQRENLLKAREALAARLAQETPKQEAALGPWLAAERLYWQALGAAADPKALAAECWETIGADPPAKENPLKPIPQVLLQRHLEMLNFLATRPKAGEELPQSLLAYFDKAIAADPDNLAWKHYRYRLLLALDRPDEMEKSLRAWIQPGRTDPTWRLALGYLLAELNRIPEAIPQFEALLAEGQLGPAECRTLADWYLVLGLKAKQEEALVAALMAESESQLGQRLYQHLNPWQRGGDALPPELDPEVIRLFTALFRKSTYPGNYLWQLQQFYQHSRDFRLLECLAEGVLGHTAGLAYSFVQQMQSVLNEVRDEATADSILAHLEKVRPRAKTPVDRRALDFLVVQVERRAAELLNQPGTHAAKALAALQRAFKEEWTGGEPRLMADFLSSMGRISHEDLAKEQVRQLEALHKGEKSGSYDRLLIAQGLGSVLWSHERWNEALDTFEAALREFQAASGGGLPSSAQGVFQTYTSYLQGRSHYGQAEKIILAELRRPANASQGQWLSQLLFQLYHNALQNGAEVSLGSGPTLYKAVEQKLIRAMLQGMPDHRYNLVNQLCSLYRTARDRQIPGVASDLKSFGWEHLPEVIDRMGRYYPNAVSTVAGAIHDLSGAPEGLSFLIERIDREPKWLRYNSQDGWSQHSWSLAQWRQEAQNPAQIEERLLKLVITELRRDLETQQSRNRNIYHRQYSYFWEAQGATFLKAAEAVWNERRNSGSAAQYIADYLYHGLNQHERSIDILFDAYRRGILDEPGQSQLVNYLHWQARFAESIPVLQALMKWRPDNLTYRCQLMHAYFQTQRRPDLLALLKETDNYLHERGLWQEGAVAQLANSCLENRLFEQSAAYYQEVIPLHQRTAPNRGIGNGTLSGYYGGLSQALAGLGRTAEAVEAAGGAIVSWGSNSNQRQYALEALRNVLRQSADLDGYAAALEKQVGETGLENPIVRKSLGQIYLERGAYGTAAEQLRLALIAQPNDAETHQALVQALERKGDAEGVVQQLLDFAELARRDMELYRDLARRFGEMGRKEEAERALTSIVEMLPQESESHAMLAEIRQVQNRWPDAIVQWEQVARIRSIEPTGHLKLAEALIHEKRWKEAKETVKTLLGKTWPQRFGDVHAQAMQLGERIPGASALEK